MNIYKKIEIVDHKVPSIHIGYVPEVTNYGLVIDELSLFSSSLLVSFYVQVLLKSNMQTTKMDI
jgi:hypothetical protein